MTWGTLFLYVVTWTIEHFQPILTCFQYFKQKIRVGIRDILFCILIWIQEVYCLVHCILIGIRFTHNMCMKKIIMLHIQLLDARGIFLTITVWLVYFLKKNRCFQNEKRHVDCRLGIFIRTRSFLYLVKLVVFIAE